VSKKERKKFLSSPEERKKLGARIPRKEVPCVECGGKAEADRKGDWRCIEYRTIPTAWIGDKVSATMDILTCNARGVTLKDGYMATTQGPPI